MLCINTGLLSVFAKVLSLRCTWVVISTCRIPTDPFKGTLKGSLISTHEPLSTDCRSAKHCQTRARSLTCYPMVSVVVRFWGVYLIGSYI